jgi:ribonuclease P protein component
MLKKINRLPATQKLKSPVFVKTHFFVLKFSKNDLPNNRFTFVVKKSFDKRAVYRNRMKRLLRSCVEEILESIKPGYDMLFLLEKGIIDNKRQEIFNILKTTLASKNLLK